MSDLEMKLAASLYAVLYDAHTDHASTAGPRGGIGGMAITSHCHLIDPYPRSMDWAELDLPSEFLRQWIREHPEVDIRAEAKALERRWLGQMYPEGTE